MTAGPDGEQFRVTAFVPYGLRSFDSGGVADGEASAAQPEGATSLEAKPMESRHDETLHDETLHDETRR